MRIKMGVSSASLAMLQLFSEIRLQISWEGCQRSCVTGSFARGIYAQRKTQTLSKVPFQNPSPFFPFSNLILSLNLRHRAIKASDPLQPGSDGGGCRAPSVRTGCIAVPGRERTCLSLYPICRPSFL